MPFPKRNKLVLVFLATENPLWQTLLGPGRVKQSDVIWRIAHIPNGTLTNWRSGEAISDEKLDEVFGSIKTFMRDKENAKLHKLSEARINEIEAFLDEVAKTIDEEMGVYEFARSIDVPVQQSQMIVDQAIYRRMPIFRDIYFDTDGRNYDDGQAHFRKYRGVYRVTIRRDGQPIRAVLRVRYLLELKGGFTIRCKLNIPKLRPDGEPERYWEYDGFMAPQEHRVFWMFEKRQVLRNDFVFLVTDDGEATPEGFVLSGQYLTTGQGSNQPIVADTLTLTRMETEDEEKMERIMHELAVPEMA